MLTREGRVKIRLWARQAVRSVPDEATVTQTAAPIRARCWGTVAYMSPEQARGAAVDSRADQFSFDLILHEMATGIQTFLRTSHPETMTAIINEDAPALDASSPRHWVGSSSGWARRLVEGRYRATIPRGSPTGRQLATGLECG